MRVDANRRFIEEVAPLPVVCAFDDLGALVHYGVAALHVVEVLISRDGHLARAAAVERQEPDVELAARPRRHHRVGGALNPFDRRQERLLGVVEWRAGKEHAAPGLSPIVRAGSADPRFTYTGRRDLG